MATSDWVATSGWVTADGVALRVSPDAERAVVRLELVWGISSWEEMCIDLTPGEATELGMRLWPAADRDRHGGMSVDLTGGSEE